MYLIYGSTNIICLPLSFSLLCHFILHIEYLTRILVCLTFRILEDDLDLYIKDTQLFLSAKKLSYIFISQ